MLLGTDLLELIGTFDDPGTPPGTDDADVLDDGVSSTDDTSPTR